MIQRMARVYVRVFISLVILWLLYLVGRLLYNDSGIWGIAALIAVILFFISIIIGGKE